MRFFKFSLACILLLALGCSRLKMAYDLGPWYLEKQARKALPDLTKEQSRRLTQDLQAYARWHRREMLPAYVEALRSLANGLTLTATSPASRLAGPLLNGLYAQTLEPLFKPSAALLYSLSPAQIQALRSKLDDRMRQQRQDLLGDPEKTFQKRLKKLRGYLEDSAGSFNAVQVTRLEKLSRAFVIPYQAWIDNKAQRQQELLRILAEKRSPAVIQALLRDWWLSPRSGGEGREKWQWDEKAEAHYISDVLALLNPAQRQRLGAKLRAMADELEAITRSPEATPKPGAAGA